MLHFREQRGVTMAEIDAKIKAQGDKIRELKAAKSDKEVVGAEVKILLALKAEFKVINIKHHKYENYTALMIDCHWSGLEAWCRGSRSRCSRRPRRRSRSRSRRWARGRAGREDQEPG